MDAETAKALRGRAGTKNFIEKDEQTFNKKNISNKLEKLELIYTEFDQADAALPFESSDMEEFEAKFTKPKPSYRIS
ncbi:hypothetical protein TNCT_710511 [Trichonephila clavata]|uniref:Uncharacterized protein n=1 Tax=Trichonephila clavata TaxID=2740835 RepID=A0A8X6H7S8_TRICU|nr:hypothetical protein TNCT_710511 [Trichonephila clavata]